MTRHRDSILALRKQGMTYKEIQAVLGCSKGTISYHLGEGQKERTRNRTNAAKHSIRVFLREVKQSSPCADCGEFYPYWVMDFDHRPEHEKSFNLSRFPTHTTDLDVVRDEIAKCDIVCANCHRTRTYARKES